RPEDPRNRAGHASSAPRRRLGPLGCRDTGPFRARLIRSVIAGDLRRGGELVSNLAVVAEVERLAGPPKVITSGEMSVYLTDARRSGRRHTHRVEARPPGAIDEAVDRNRRNPAGEGYRVSQPDRSPRHDDRARTAGFSHVSFNRACAPARGAQTLIRLVR